MVAHKSTDTVLSDRRRAFLMTSGLGAMAVLTAVGRAEAQRGGHLGEHPKPAIGRHRKTGH